MTLLPGETADAEVRFPDDHPDESRRGQSRARAGHAARGEAPGAAAARRRLRARGRRLREPRRAPRGGPRTTWSARPTREADAQVRQALVQQVVEANNVAGAASRWCTGCMHALRRDVPGARRSSSTQFEQQFHQIAEAQVRRDLVLDAVVESQRAPGHRGRARRAGRRSWPRRAASRPASSTPPCRRPTGCPSSSARITEEKAFAWLLQQSTVDEAKS